MSAKRLRLAAPESLATQANLGPKSAAMLATAGIDTLGKLRRLGSVAAYLKVKKAGLPASLNLLWALEGALTGQHWRVVARERRTALLIELDDSMRTAKGIRAGTPARS